MNPRTSADRPGQLLRRSVHGVLLLLAGATVVAGHLLGIGWPAAVVSGVAVLGLGEALGRCLPHPQPVQETEQVAGARGTGGAPAPLPAGAHFANPLTRRELEVALLVARGLRNKEIAHRLFLSERTVDNHIHHSFNRLNLSGRVELAAWVHEHGLLREMSTEPE
ncbi:MAG: response regulator transcription factor [Candidatus Dormibacteria bacterium]